MNTNKNRTVHWLILLIVILVLLSSTLACGLGFSLLRQPHEPEWDHQEMHPMEPGEFLEPNLRDDVHLIPVDPDADHPMEHEFIEPEIMPVEPFIPEEPGLEKIPGWEPSMGPVNPSLEWGGACAPGVPESECRQD